MLPSYKLDEWKDFNSAFGALLALQQECQKKLTAKPTVDSKYIVTPQDQEASAALNKIVAAGSLQGKLLTLTKLESPTIAVIPRVPKDISPQELQELNPNVIKAIRLTTYDHVAKQAVPTNSVKIWMKGPLQSTIDLGPLGFRELRPFVPEPTRCYRCQKYGHTQKTCTQNYRCSLCAQNHATEVCLNKKKDGQDISLKCPNCKGPHSAASQACPVRKQKARETTQRFQANLSHQAHQQSPPSQTPPAPTDTVNFPSLSPAPLTAIQPTATHLVTSDQLQKIITAVIELITSLIPSAKTHIDSIQNKIQEITTTTISTQPTSKNLLQTQPQNPLQATHVINPQKGTQADSTINQNKAALKRPSELVHNSQRKKTPREISTIYQDPPFTETDPNHPPYSPPEAMSH